jgi:hypothetical protein
MAQLKRHGISMKSKVGLSDAVRDSFGGAPFYSAFLALTGLGRQTGDLATRDLWVENSILKAELRPGTPGYEFWLSMVNELRLRTAKLLKEWENLIDPSSFTDLTVASPGETQVNGYSDLLHYPRPAGLYPTTRFSILKNVPYDLSGFILLVGFILEPLVIYENSERDIGAYSKLVALNMDKLGSLPRKPEGPNLRKHLEEFIASDLCPASVGNFSSWYMEIWEELNELEQGVAMLTHCSKAQAIPFYVYQLYAIASELPSGHEQPWRDIKVDPVLLATQSALQSSKAFSE